MRVAFVKRRYHPTGGGERYLAALLEALHARGWELSLVGERWDRLPAGVAMVALRHGRRGRSGYFAFARAVSRHLRRTPYDVVVSLDRTVGQDIYRAGEGVHREWLARRRRFESGPGVWWSAVSPAQRRLRAAEAACLESSRFIAVNSEMTGREIARHFPRLESRLRLVRNGIDLQRFRPATGSRQAAELRAALGLPDGVPILAFVGNGFRRKGLAPLLEVVQVLPAVHLAVLGADRWGPWRGRAVAFGVAQRVHRLPPETRTDDLLRAADLFVLPTLFDPCSNATLEALACGVPVVTTAFNGAAELLRRPGQGLVLGRPDDCRGMQFAIQEILPAALALREDPAGRDEVRQAVADLELAHATERMAALIEEAARARGQGPPS